MDGLMNNNNFITTDVGAFDNMRAYDTLSYKTW